MKVRVITGTGLLLAAAALLAWQMKLPGFRGATGVVATSPLSPRERGSGEGGGTIDSSPRPDDANANQPLVQSARPEPGALSAVDAAPIRVNLTPTPVRRVQLGIDGPYRIEHRTTGNGIQVLGRDNRFPPAEIHATPTGFHIGAKDYTASDLEIVADNAPAIWIGDNQYRGRVRLERQSSGRFVVVNVLPLGEYLASVVDSEMPLAFPAAARQAQAIVSRTYALYQMSRGHPQFDVFATSRSQLYRGYQYRDSAGRRLAGESPASRQVVRDTASQVCLYRGSLFCTYFSAVCGGVTTPGHHVFSDAAPPLQSVTCHWCRDSRHYRWSREIAKAEASLCLSEFCAARKLPFGELKWIVREAAGQPAAAAIFQISDGRHHYRFASADLRSQLAAEALPSPHFAIEDRGNRLAVSGRGHGHGVGLCQWGARGLAAAGYNCRQILEHYYPGTHVGPINRNRTTH